LSEISFERKLEENSQDTVITPWNKDNALGDFVDHPPSIKYLPLMVCNQRSVGSEVKNAWRKTLAHSSK